MAKELRLPLIEPTEQLPTEGETILFVLADERERVIYGAFSCGVFFSPLQHAPHTRPEQVKFWCALPKRLPNVVTED